jgi:hypothetical protein
VSTISPCPASASAAASSRTVDSGTLALVPRTEGSVQNVQL